MLLGGRGPGWLASVFFFCLRKNGLKKTAPEKISEPDWRKPYPALLKKNCGNGGLQRNKAKVDALSG